MEREAAFAPRVSWPCGVLPEVIEDVSGPAGGGQRRMFSLLGATTLVLVAGAPWALPAAPGEKRVPGRGRRLGGGGAGSLGPGRPVERADVWETSARPRSQRSDRKSREKQCSRILPRRSLGGQRTLPPAGDALRAVPPQASSR